MTHLNLSGSSDLIEGLHFNVSQSIQKKFSGTTPQFQGTLFRNGQLIPVRIKSDTNATEASFYQQIFNSQDPIKEFLPEFYGVHKAPSDPRSYTVLKELDDGLSTTRMNDFKFCKRSLLGNRGELIKHGHKERNICEFLKPIVCKCFSYQSVVLSANKIKGSRNILVLIYNLFKRIVAYFNTKNTLNGYFNELNADEIANAIQYLSRLKVAIKNSDYAFCDSSLLFISRLEGGVRKLEIRLIDLSHAVERSEEIPEFEQIKKDLEDSVEDLITQARKIQGQAALIPSAVLERGAIAPSGRSLVSLFCFEAV